MNNNDDFRLRIAKIVDRAAFMPSSRGDDNETFAQKQALAKADEIIRAFIEILAESAAMTASEVDVEIDPGSGFTTNFRP